MPERNLFLIFLAPLNRLKIPYMVTGGMAVFVWGRPRFTADIDIVIEIEPPKIEDLEKALLSLEKSGYLDKDLMLRALHTNGEFNFIDWTTGTKVDFWIYKKQDPFDISRFKRRRAKKILGEMVYFTSPEDLILIKLLWFGQSESTRQLEDIESVLKISGDKLDMNYLNKWAKKQGVFKILSRLKNK